MALEIGDVKTVTSDRRLLDVSSERLPRNKGRLEKTGQKVEYVDRRRVGFCLNRFVNAREFVTALNQTRLASQLDEQWRSSAACCL